MDATQYIDTYEFTRLGRSIDGTVPLERFARLLEDLPGQPDASVVTWSLRGEQSAAGERFLQLHVQACPRLTCQRCLAPLDWTVESESRLRLVDSEASLDEDAPGGVDEDDEDRILGARRFDVLALVEDEVILSLPLVPKHDVCPSGPKLVVARDDQSDVKGVAASPFAVLGTLKKD